MFQKHIEGQGHLNNFSEVNFKLFIFADVTEICQDIVMVVLSEMRFIWRSGELFPIQHCIVFFCSPSRYPKIVTIVYSNFIKVIQKNIALLIHLKNN